MDMFDSLLWWTLKGSAILLLAFCATLLLRRKPAAVRHAVWCVAVLAQLFVPASDWMPESRAVAVNVPVRLTAAPVWSAAPVGAALKAEALPPHSIPSMLVIVVAGAILLLLRLAIGTVRVSWITRRSPRVADGGWLEIVQRHRAVLRLARPVTLVRSDRVCVPVTWGFVRPAILLPLGADAWPEDHRRHVLLHELAHVKRGDALTQLAAQVVLALFWFNPLVWLAVRRMRAEAEHACDDYVLRAGERPAVYATTLFELVRAHDGAGVPAFASLSVARRSDLEQRVRAITDPARDVAVRRALSVFAIAAALVIVLPLSAVQRAAQKVRTFEGRMFEHPAQSRDACQPVVMTGMGFGEASGTMTRDGKTVAYFFLRPEAGRCIESSFSLNARFTDDDRDLVPVPGLEAIVREKRGGTDRVVSIGESNGLLVRRYNVNGRAASWDAAAERWYRTLLPEVVRLTQAGIEPRARRIVEDEGVAGLIAEVGRIPANTGVRREYLTVLLALRTADELPREQAIGYARAALEYEPDLAQFLATLARREGASEDVLASVLRATADLEEIADRNTVLDALAAHEAVAVRLAALDALALLPGDVWRRTFLADNAHAYLDTGNAFLVDAYFAAADAIGHGREKRELLDTLGRETWPLVVQRRLALASAELR